MKKRLSILFLTLAMLIVVCSFTSFAENESLKNMSAGYKNIFENADLYKVNYYGIYVDFCDINDDGLPEMLMGVNGNNSSIIDIQVWTYHNGAVKQAGVIEWGLAACSNILFKSNNGGVCLFWFGEKPTDKRGTYYSVDGDGNLISTNTVYDFPDYDVKEYLFMPNEYGAPYMGEHSVDNLAYYNALNYIEMLPYKNSEITYLDPVGIYVPDEGIGLDIDGETIQFNNYIRIYKGTDGGYNILAVPGQKSISYESIATFPVNEPFKIHWGKKGRVYSETITYNGTDTVTIQYMNDSKPTVYHRIYDSIKYHMAKE